MYDTCTDIYITDIHILKSQHTLTFYSKYSRALTFENVCRVQLFDIRIRLEEGVFREWSDHRARELECVG